MDSQTQNRQTVYERGLASIAPNVPTHLSRPISSTGPAAGNFDPFGQTVLVSEADEVGEAEVSGPHGLTAVNGLNASNAPNGERRLPPELWLHVLLFLTTEELRTTSSLSTFFYHLSIPILYECVEWKIGWRGLASASYSTRMLMGPSSSTGRSLRFGAGGGNRSGNAAGIEPRTRPTASNGNDRKTSGSAETDESNNVGSTRTNPGIGDTADTVDHLDSVDTYATHGSMALNYPQIETMRGNGILDRVKICKITRKLEGRQTLNALRKGKGPKHRHDANPDEWLPSIRSGNNSEDNPAETIHHGGLPGVVLPPYSYISVIIRMSNLRRLSLNEILLPYDFIRQIPNLVHLRELEIRSCDIESSYTYEQAPEEWDFGTESPSPLATQWQEDASTMLSPEAQVPAGGLWEASRAATATGSPTLTARITHLTLLGIQMSLEPLLLPPYIPTSHIRRYTGGIEYFYRTVVTPSLTYLHTTSFELTSIKKIFEDLVTSYNNAGDPNGENTSAEEQTPNDTSSTDTEDEANEIFRILKHFCVSYCVRPSGADGLLPFLWRFGQGITQLELSNKDDSESSNHFREWIEGNLSPLVQTPGSTAGSSSPARRFLPNLTSYVGPSPLLDVLYRGRDLRHISIRDRLPKIGRSDWRTDDGDTGSPAVEGLLDALEGWGLTNNANAQQVATALVFGNNPQNPIPTVNLNLNQTTNLQDLLSHWVANRSPQRSQLGRDAVEVDMRKLEDVKIVKEMAGYLGRTVQMALRHLGSKGIILERLEFTLVTWDVDLLLMVMNIMPSLKELEIRCYKQGPDEQFFMSFWGNFLHMLPNLQRLHIYDLSLPSVPSRPNLASPDQLAANSHDFGAANNTKGEKPEAMSMQDQRQAVRMISRFRPSFSEMSMTRAIVWKRLPYLTADEIATGRGWAYEVRQGYENTRDDPLMPMPKPSNGHNRSGKTDRNDSNGSGSGNHDPSGGTRDGGHGSTHPSTSNPSHPSNSANRHSQQRGGGKFHPSGANTLSMFANQYNRSVSASTGTGSGTGIYSAWRDVIDDDMEDDDDDYEMAAAHDPESASENGDIDSDDSMEHHRQSGHQDRGPLWFPKRRGETSHIGQRIQPPQTSQRILSPILPHSHTQSLQSHSPELVPNSPQHEQRTPFTATGPHHNGHHYLNERHDPQAPHNVFLNTATLASSTSQMNTISASDMAFYASLQPGFNQISLDHHLHDDISPTTASNSTTFLGQGQPQSQGRVRDMHTRSRSRSIHPLQLYPDEHDMHSLQSAFPSQPTQTTQSFYSPYSPPYDSTSLSASVSTPASHTAFQLVSNHNHNHDHNHSTSSSISVSASGPVGQHHRGASDSFFGFGYKYGASPYEHESALYNQAYNQSLDMDLGGFFDAATLSNNPTRMGPNVGNTYEEYDTDHSYYDTSVLYSGTSSSAAGAGPGRSRAHSMSDSGVWSELVAMENLHINMMDTRDGTDGMSQNMVQSMDMMGMHSMQSGQQMQSQDQQLEMHIDHEEEEDADFVNVAAHLYPRYVHMWD